MPDTAEATTEKVDLWNMFFQQKHGMPGGWRWVEVDCSKEVAPDGYARIRGAIAPPWKHGLTDWKNRQKGSEATFFFKLSDLRAFEKKYWNDQGKCHKCEGTGQQKCGWNKDSGVKLRPCDACDSTGTLVTPAA
jgi:hypothetical protein